MMEKPWITILFSVVMMSLLCEAFHLQGDPGIRQSVCRQARPCCPGHVCRAYQRFDTSRPVAACARSLESSPLYAPGSSAQRRYCPPIMPPSPFGGRGPPFGGRSPNFGGRGQSFGGSGPGMDQLGRAGPQSSAGRRPMGQIRRIRLDGSQMSSQFPVMPSSSGNRLRMPPPGFSGLQRSRSRTGQDFMGQRSGLPGSPSLAMPPGFGDQLSQQGFGSPASDVGSPQASLGGQLNTFAQVPQNQRQFIQGQQSFGQGLSGAGQGQSFGGRDSFGQSFQGFSGGNPSGQRGFSGGISSGQSGFSGGLSLGQPGFSSGLSSGQSGFSGGIPSGQQGFPGGLSSGQPGFSSGLSSGQSGFSGGIPSGQLGFSGGPRSGQMGASSQLSSGPGQMDLSMTGFQGQGQTFGQQPRDILSSSGGVPQSFLMEQPPVSATAIGGGQSSGDQGHGNQAGLTPSQGQA